MPAISVIVPVYKVEKYIHRCVDSILGQTFKDYELILVDDGSPDNCGAICDEYAAKDSRVRVIHQENGGLSAARNAGIDWAFANSDSQWITFIDSDDWVHPQYLEVLYHAVRTTDTKVSICAYQETDGTEPDIKTIPDSVIYQAEDYFVTHTTNATVVWGKLYAKDCFQSIRYPVGKIHEDEYVTYRILFPVGKISFIPTPLYAYYINSEGITKRPWTPKRLDAVAAFNQQRRYFKANHFEKAHQLATQYLVSNLCAGIEQLNQLKIKSESRRLRRLLAAMLLMYTDRYPIKKDNIWLYEQAFPRIMYVYWTAVGIGNKIKRSLKICRK